MNVTINIYGDVHINCDCYDECGSCGEYSDNFEDAIKVPYEAEPDAENSEEIELSEDEIEAVTAAMTQSLLSFLPTDLDE